MSTVTSPEKRARKSKSDSRDAPVDDAALPWFQSTWTLSLVSGLLLWLAFPPVGLWPLAWIAPIGWIVLIRRKKLDGPRPYRTIWLAAFLHWLVLFQFVRIPHWGLYIGWFALAAYLAIYLTLFVGLSRVAVHRLRVNSIVATAIVWVGLELARGHVASGISLALLGHSQVHWSSLIQIADLCGAYGMSFIMMLVAASIACMIPIRGRKSLLGPAIVIVAVFGLTLLYGNHRLSQTVAESKQETRQVALIQGSIDTILDLTEDEAEQRHKQIIADYTRLTVQALHEHPELDLVVWPEGKFAFTDLQLPGDFYRARKVKPEARAEIEKVQMEFDEGVTDLLVSATAEHPYHLLLGTHSIRVGARRWQHYNAALLMNSQGKIENEYFKMHRVPFGEYVYFGDWVPWLYEITPIPAPLNAGTDPAGFDVAGLTYAPSICFESTVPHLVHRQLDALERQGTAADVMVNITDDGWFMGSSCLDHHLACSVFRTVEHRTPMVIAANTGFSAWIDGNGRILAQGPRRAEAVLYAEVYPDRRTSLYQTLGDWPAFGCLAFCLACALVGFRQTRKEVD